ncbi:MAG: ABC transporter permease [Chloroherpetonaceae bacterium]
MLAFSRSTLIVLNVIVFLVLCGYVLVPSFAALKESLFAQGAITFGYYERIFSASRYLAAMLNTLFVSALTVACAGAVGTALAFLFWQYTFPFKQAISQILLLPIGLPPLIGVFAFQLLYSESGILPRAIQAAFGLSEVPFSFEGTWAVLFVHVYSFFVHFYLFVYASLSKVDYALVEAARTFGASRAKVFVKIILPLIRPALLSASLIVFVLSTASFTAPLLFANKTPFLTVEIYNQKIGGEFGIASGLTVLLVLMSSSLLLVFEKLNDVRMVLAQRGSLRSVPMKPLSLGVATGLVGMVLFVVLPIAILVLMSFSETPASSRSIFPTDFGIGNYVRVFKDANFYEPFVNSFSMAILASVMNLFFGVIAGMLIASGKMAFKSAVSVVFLLPFALPATALGVNLIATFNQPSLLAFGQTLVGTVWILPLAYFIRHLPYITRSVSSVLSSFDKSLSEAAASLGASPARVVRRVIVPIALSAIASGFLFTFVSAFSEFPCSVLLYSPDAVPISVAIFSSLRLGEFGVASAQGVLLLGVVLALTVGAQWIFKSTQKEPLGF